MELNKIINKVQIDGFCVIENFLDTKDLELLERLTKNYSLEKGNNLGKYPIGYKSLIIKLIKFEFKKIYDTFLLKKFANKFNFENTSNKILKYNTELINIDTYFNDISSEPVLDWHCDLSNKSSSKVAKIINPEMVSVKFFFYLTDVYTNNGCLSYIPGSHIIVKEVGRLIFSKEIDYEYYWSLKALTALIRRNDVRKKLEKNLNPEVIENFLSNSDKILIQKKNDIFDLQAKKGGVVIFNEYGVHRGSKIEKEPRKIIRFFYRKKGIYEKFRDN
tara:strand:- start:10322 stop:11146 length:825 start_codon:yes stop_codon:yes gene_type:complete